MFVQLFLAFWLLLLSNIAILTIALPKDNFPEPPALLLKLLVS